MIAYRFILKGLFSLCRHDWNSNNSKLISLFNYTSKSREVMCTWTQREKQWGYLLQIVMLYIIVLFSRRKIVGILFNIIWLEQWGLKASPLELNKIINCYSAQRESHKIAKSSAENADTWKEESSALWAGDIDGAGCGTVSLSIQSCFSPVWSGMKHRLQISSCACRANNYL